MCTNRPSQKIPTRLLARITCSYSHAPVIKSNYTHVLPSSTSCHITSNEFPFLSALFLSSSLPSLFILYLSFQATLFRLPEVRDHQRRHPAAGAHEWLTDLGLPPAYAPSFLSWSFFFLTYFIGTPCTYQCRLCLCSRFFELDSLTGTVREQVGRGSPYFFFKNRLWQMCGDLEAGAGLFNW